MKRAITAVLSAACCVAVLTSPASAASHTTECSGTLNGSYDSIVVPAGATCTLDGATVSKNVTVETGASLFTSGASIGGNLMSRDAKTVRVIDTDVHRNLEVSGTHGITKIGGKGCHIDPSVANNLMLKGNHGNVAICDLTIARNLALMGNTGPVGVFHNTVGNNLMLFNNTGPVNRVRHNDIRINLNCHGNPHRIITVANTAHKIMGQCHS